MGTVWAQTEQQRELLDVIPDGFGRWLRSETVQVSAAATAVLGVLVVVTAISSRSPLIDRPAVYSTLRVVGCAGSVAIAFVFARRRTAGRMTWLMLTAAFVLAADGLTASKSPWGFAVGRIAATAAVLVLMWVCFAYPSGRIVHRPSLQLLQVSSVVMLVLLAANLLFVRVQPVGGPFVRCSGTGCPASPLAIFATHGGTVPWLSTGLALTTAVALVACAATLIARAAGATTLQRHSLIPMASWGALTAVSFAVFVSVRALDPYAAVLDPFAIVLAAFVAVLPAAIGTGLVRGRVLAMSALEHMILELREHSGLARLQHDMAAVFEDPELRLLAWRDGQHAYVDSAGSPADVTALGDDRMLTEFTRDGRTVGGAVHDPMLADDVVRAAGSVVVLALDNDRLQSDLTRSVEALESSRQRVLSAADQERRRIEQDLHDGAQQGLIALRIKLHLLREVAVSDPQSLTAGLADAGARVDAALDQIRNLAQGVYPSVLRDLGLSYAMASVARELPVEVGLHIDVKRRLDPEVETAVYFCCVEALQNAVKHAGPDARIEVWMAETRGRLQFAVADTGAGFEPSVTASERGLNGMHDRIEAVGGRLAVRSSPGEGTVITGAIPRPGR